MPGKKSAIKNRRIKMKITVFNGSPKAGHGNTSVLVENFLQGAKQQGAEVEQVFLSKYQIKHCTSCKSCWEKTPGKCSQTDDMPELLTKVLESDVMGFASPVFVDNVTGIMKTFMDRLIVLGDPHWEKDEFGECKHMMRYSKPNKMLIFSNCGYPEQSHFQVIRLFYKRVARNMGWEIVGEIYRAGGALLTSKEETIKPFLDKYKLLLQKAGSELITNSKVTNETSVELEKPMFPIDNLVDVFISRVNKICDDRLNKFSKA